MTSLTMIAADLLAIALLTGVYFHRHGRRDLIVAFLGVNVGVLAVATVLGSASVSMGVGLGLFGVLSIIRLRSSEISQREVAYYFAALAIGLVAGLPTASVRVPLALIALILAVMWVADHPALLSRSRQQTVTLDRAISDETELRDLLGALLGGQVQSVIVQHLDLVRDLTVVDVRYRLLTDQSAGHPVAQAQGLGLVSTR